MSNSKIATAAASAKAGQNATPAAFRLPANASFNVTTVQIQSGVQTVEVYDGIDCLWQSVLTSDAPVGTNKLQAASGNVTISFNALGADEARTYAAESDEFVGLAKIKSKSGDVLAVAFIEWQTMAPQKR